MRNPQDTTLRNARAATKAIAALEVRVSRLEHPTGRSVEQELHTIKQRFENIENAFYEFFTGIEAAQQAALSLRPQKGRKR